MTAADDLQSVQPDLPAPRDDGAAAHLLGMTLPPIRLWSTLERWVDLSALGDSPAVIYCYSKTGRPDRAVPADWDSIPGARGCTVQACSYRDHSDALRTAGASVYGLSTQDPAYQREMADRLHLPYEILSDAGHQLTRALRLPTFEYHGELLLKRLTLIAERGRIVGCLYPVFPSDADLDWVLARLGARRAPRSDG